ncbi:MAG: transglycosylase domain-containing protein [Cytophagales bacterium]
MRKSSKVIAAIWIVFVSLVLGIVLFFYSVSINFMNLYGTLPGLKILENPESEVASEIYFSDRNSRGELKIIGKYYRQNRSNTKYEDLSPHLINALLAQEDARFYKHSGIDFEAILRAVIFLGSQGGGSTLTQQLAKNLFKIRGDHNNGILKDINFLKINIIIAKAKEMLMAIKLEKAYTKQEIMTMYLNTVDFGSNAFGIKVASETFFGKSPEQVNIEEAAVLVGILGATYSYNPVYNYDNSINRRNRVLGQMHKYGYINDKEYDSLSNLEINLEYYDVDNQSKGLATYFRSVVKLDLMRWCKTNGYDLFADGLKVYTTIDSRLQQHAEKAIEQHMPELQNKFNEHWKGRNPWVDENFRELRGYIQNSVKRLKYYKNLKEKYAKHPDSVDYYINLPKKLRVFSWNGDIDTTFSTIDSLKYYRHILHAGFMAMDFKNGHIKAWVGGIDHRYFKYDHVRQGKRQPGSTFKPIVYTAAIDNGYTPCFELEDAPVTFILPTGESYTPQNAEGRWSYEKLTLRQALGRSVNSVTANLMKRVGIEVVVDYAKKLGIQSELAPVPSLCLGTSDLSLYELVGTYGTFANKGLWTEPFYIQRIEDKYGNVLKEFLPKTKEALNAQTAEIMLYMLRGATEERNGTALGLYRWDLRKDNMIAAKTGTTSNYSDGWFMGITKDLVAGAWVGAEERAIHFRSIALGSGSRMAMPIWGLFMQNIYADSTLNYEKGEFEQKVKLDIELDCSKFNNPFANDSVDVEIPDLNENPDRDIFN